MDNIKVSDMRLIDLFAMAAMHAYILQSAALDIHEAAKNPEWQGSIWSDPEIAEYAYSIAHTMITERRGWQDC